MATILEMTNRKLDGYIKSIVKKIVNNRYLNPITLPEIKSFISLLILTRVFRANREPIDELYREDLNFETPTFRAAMPRERFKNILRFLRFEGNTTRIERVLIHKLAPIRDILESINKAFYAAYTPGKLNTIDEHLCNYHRRCQFLQYLRNKPDKYAINIWVPANAGNYYPLNLEVFTG